MTNVSMTKGQDSIMSTRTFAVGWVFLVSMLLSLPVHSQVVDEFDDDPRDNPDWEFYEPETPAEYDHDAGYFLVTIPAGALLTVAFFFVLRFVLG